MHISINTAQHEILPSQIEPRIFMGFAGGEHGNNEVRLVFFFFSFFSFPAMIFFYPILQTLRQRPNFVY